MTRLLFCVFLSNVFLVWSHVNPLLTLGTECNDGSQCTTKLGTCEVNVGSGPLKLDYSIKGAKGTRGIQGSQGLQGTRGEKGESGDSKYKSSDHWLYWGTYYDESSQIEIEKFTGDKGPKGGPGEEGRMGNSGQRGLRGDEGAPGFPGMKGPKGDRGETRHGIPGEPLPGPKGSSGPTGIIGSCICPSYEDESERDDIISVVRGSTKDRPARVVCKDMHNDITLSEYYIGPGGIKVECRDFKGTKLTCIPPLSPENKNSTRFSQNDMPPFWLSSKGVTVESIYGVSPHQISWIQQQSNSAFQTIYYYSNRPLSLGNYEESDYLKLLSFNEIVFGPTSSETTTFTYNIKMNDAEVEGKGYSYILNLKSEPAQRLPVIDFLVPNLPRNADQSVRIEHKELCFD